MTVVHQYSSPQKSLARRGSIHHVDLLSTIKNIDAGDHILQRDRIPGPVSPARQPATNAERGKWVDRVKNDIRIPVLTHTSFRGQFFDGVWKEGMETLGEGGLKVCMGVGGLVRFCTVPLVRRWDLAWAIVLIFILPGWDFFTIHYWQYWIFLVTLPRTQSQAARHRTLPSKVRKIRQSNYFVGLWVISTLHVTQEANSIKPIMDNNITITTINQQSYFVYVWCGSSH